MQQRDVSTGRIGTKGLHKRGPQGRRETVRALSGNYSTGTRKVGPERAKSVIIIGGSLSLEH